MSDEGDQNWRAAAREDYFSAGPYRNVPPPAPKPPPPVAPKTPGLHGWFGFERNGRACGINLDHVVTYEVLPGEDHAAITIRLCTVAGTLVEITDEADTTAFRVREDEEYGVQ